MFLDLGVRGGDGGRGGREGVMGRMGGCGGNTSSCQFMCFFHKVIDKHVGRDGWEMMVVLY